MDLLYEWMKQSLKHFGLRFSEMDKVRVVVESGKITFIYEDMEVSYIIPVT